MTVRAGSLQESIDLAKRGQDSMVKCPAHDDGMASLHVGPGDKQPVIMKCHAGCDVNDIMYAAGIDKTEILAPKADEWKVRCAVPQGQQVRTAAGYASHIYEYQDEEGKLLFEVLRIPLQNGKKQFRQRRLENGQYVWNMDGVRRVLYRLPEIELARKAGWPVWVVEGEKDVETLLAKFETADVKACATTSPMGAGKWDESYSEMLAGMQVKLIADADDAGRKHAREVRASLIGHGCDVTMMEPMQGAKDVTQHFEYGGSLQTLLVTMPSDQTKRETYGIDILTLIKRDVKAVEYVIPGTLAKGDRWLLTAFEGHGKSELIRQVCIMTAAGIHPWLFTEYDPKRVLLIDAENGPDQTIESWQNLVGLAARHGRPVQRGMLTVLEEYDSELDLTSPAGFDWMMERVHAYQPELIGMGPLYNMVNRDLKDDEVVRKLKHVVNSARAICGSAIIMEHHAPHKGPTDHTRSVRPYGSSMFLKWPDFGYGLQPVKDKEDHYEWKRLRFPRVRSRNWPEFMRNGHPNTDEWPWMPCVKVDEGEYI